MSILSIVKIFFIVRFSQVKKICLLFAGHLIVESPELFHQSKLIRWCLVWGWQVALYYFSTGMLGCTTFYRGVKFYHVMVL